MGVVLFNACGEGFSSGIGAGWAILNCLAERYGWIPKGTEYPPFEEDYDTRENYDEGRRVWSGGYFTNDTQIVTADDARALADVLDRALLEMPDEDPPKKTHAEIAKESPEESEVRWCSWASKEGPGSGSSLLFRVLVRFESANSLIGLNSGHIDFNLPFQLSVKKDQSEGLTTH